MFLASRNSLTKAPSRCYLETEANGSKKMARDTAAFILLDMRDNIAPTKNLIFEFKNYLLTRSILIRKILVFC